MTPEQQAVIERELAAWLQEMVTKRMVHEIVINTPEFEHIQGGEFAKLNGDAQSAEWEVSVKWKGVGNGDTVG